LKKIGILILLLSGGMLSAQSNEVLDTFLTMDNSDFATTVYLVLSASGVVPEDVPPRVAYQALLQKGWGFPQSNTDRPVLWGEYSLLLMKAFNLKGGILYSVLGGQRYAVKEVNFLRLLPYDKGIYDPITPYEAMLALQTLMEDKAPEEIAN